MSRKQVEARLIRKVAQLFKVAESDCRIDGDVHPWAIHGRVHLYAQVHVKGQGSTMAMIDPRKKG